jgi:hypothetical protein
MGFSPWMEEQGKKRFNRRVKSKIKHSLKRKLRPLFRVCSKKRLLFTPFHGAKPGDFIFKDNNVRILCEFEEI